MADHIASVAVVGGEIVGWTVAAALKRHLPYLQVTVVPADSSGEDPANRLASTLPSISAFHEDIGLTDADTIVRAGSSIRLGTRFIGWAPEGAETLHVYGDYGQAAEGTAFHQLWLRAGSAAGPFSDYSLAAAMARENRFATAPEGPLSEVQFGLQIDPKVYGEMMSAYAEHLGVQQSRTQFADVRLDLTVGHIAAAILTDGSEVVADLYVDCTGPRALVRSALDHEVADWSKWLPCDEILVAEGPAPDRLPIVDEVVALESGWRWEAKSPRRTGAGVCYSTRHSERAEASAQIEGYAVEQTLTLRQGCRPSPWLRNCVAVGASAFQIEPLEWTNLHLVHSAADRIVSMMPGRDCTPVELAEYNRQSVAEAERIRDFLLLRYVTSARSEPLWAEIRAQELPASLSHSLTLFQERGRLPFYEEETFARDSWVALLFAHGIRPRRRDPLVDRIDPQTAALGMSRLRQMIATAVPQLPTHEQFLGSLHRQVAR
jgi:tryptophan halogenase